MIDENRFEESQPCGRKPGISELHKNKPDEGKTGEDTPSEQLRHEQTHRTSTALEHNNISAWLTQIPAMQLPLSHYMSMAAKRAFVSRNFNPPELQSVLQAWGEASTQRAAQTSDIEALRDGMDTHLFAPMARKAMSRYDVRIRREHIGGVPICRIEPAQGVSAENQHRVLINLHGGFFTVGAGNAGLVESAPIAALLRITVISVDYRQGPEYRFPAASEDVSAVFQALLADYPARNIGIFGASAGGMLAAMTLTLLQRKQLPRPGAVALLSAAATASMSGDSQFLAPAAMGDWPPPPVHLPVMPVAYLEGVDPDDPLVAPVSDSAVLRMFPPVLLITGSRAFDLSAAIHTHRCLLRAGASAELQLWDGMWHCFFYDADLPESIEASTLLSDFFDQKLGRSILGNGN